MKQAEANMFREESYHRAADHLPAALLGQFIINGRGFPCQIVTLSRNAASIRVASDALDQVRCVAARLRIDGLRLFDVRIRWRSDRGIGLSFEKGRLSDAEIAKLSSSG